MKRAQNVSVITCFVTDSDKLSPLAGLDPYTPHLFPSVQEHTPPPCCQNCAVAPKERPQEVVIRKSTPRSGGVPLGCLRQLLAWNHHLCRLAKLFGYLTVVSD